MSLAILCLIAVLGGFAHFFAILKWGWMGGLGAIASGPAIFAALWVGLILFTGGFHEENRFGIGFAFVMVVMGGSALWLMGGAPASIAAIIVLHRRRHRGAQAA